VTKQEKVGRQQKPAPRGAFDLGALAKELSVDGVRAMLAVNSAPIGYLSTGLGLLDASLGGRGFPWGQMIHVWGDPGTGKSALGYKAIATFQALVPDGVAILADAEHAYNSLFASRIGVDERRILQIEAKTGEQYMVALGAAISKASAALGPCKVLAVLDSVANLIPREVMELEVDEKGSQASRARMLTQRIYPLRDAVVTGGATLLLLNQVRKQLNVMFGSPDHPPGGMAMEHAIDMSVRFSHRGKIIRAEGADPEGSKVATKVDKSRSCYPFRQAAFSVYFWGHVSDEEHYASALHDYDIITTDVPKEKREKGKKKDPEAEAKKKGASHYYFHGKHLGYGEGATNKAIATDPVLREELLVLLTAAMNPSAPRASFSSEFALPPPGAEQHFEQGTSPGENGGAA